MAFRRACLLLAGVFAACLFLKRPVSPFILADVVDSWKRMVLPTTERKSPINDHRNAPAIRVLFSETRHVIVPNTSVHMTSLVNRQPNPQTQYSFNEERRRRIKKILILAYYRSGSSLTGSFFEKHPSTFYIYEPIFALNRAILTNSTLIYFNGQTRLVPKDMDSAIFNIMEAYFKCDFNSLDWGTLEFGLRTHADLYFLLMDCAKRIPSDGGFMEKVRETCLPPIVTKCLFSDAIAIKSIRVRMPVAERLLRAFPDLKVIHLHRDPRGMACSLHRGDCRSSLLDAKGTCEILSSDKSLKQNLPRNSSARFLDVKYEALVQEPLGTVRDMFKFVKIPFQENVARWMFVSLFSNREVEGTMSLTKSNPLATAFRWTSVINWNVVRLFQHLCAGVIADHGYPTFNNLREVRSFKIPTRNKARQREELRGYLMIGGENRG